MAATRDDLRHRRVEPGEVVSVRTAPASTGTERPLSGAAAAPKRASRAFTLIELLVAAGIIALLVGILLPELTAARGLARTAICQHNLHGIHEAFVARANDQVTGKAPTLRIGGWPGALLPYLGNNVAALTCPEGGEFYRGTCEEQLQVRFYGSGFDYIIMLDGPFVAKMSNTQYQAVCGAGYMHHGRVLSECPVYDGYECDDQPEVVWFCIEEITPASEGQSGLQSGAPANDLEDIRMRVSDNNDGTFSLFFDLGSGGLDADITRGDGEVLVTIPEGYPRSDVEAGPFDGGFSGCSYGMNGATELLHPAPGKILALDYERTVARSSDDWTSKGMDPDLDGVPLFARHRDRINVLFRDGSVKRMWPQQIDPASLPVAGAYWDPSTGP